MLARSAAGERPRNITIGPIGLAGLLGVPPGSAGIVLFAHGSGSGRFSPRNEFVAQALREAGFAASPPGFQRQDVAGYIVDIVRLDHKIWHR
jgi:predicted dienelactone hydrolase